MENKERFNGNCISTRGVTEVVKEEQDKNKQGEPS